MNYLKHFGLRELPFGITPDTSFFFACRSIREALNTLLVATANGEGFIKITGEVGTGKTLLCRKFLSTLGTGWVSAYIPNPNLEPRSLLLALADELGVATNRERHRLDKDLMQRLLDLARQGRRVVLCLDETQAMPSATLEAVRLLTSMEFTLYTLNGFLIVGASGLAIWLWSLGAVSIGAIAVVMAWSVWEHRKLSKTYKTIVVRRVVDALGHGLSYSADSRFTKRDFLDMDLFNLRCEQWRAEDEVCGRKNAVTYSILEAKATRTEGSGKNRRTITIFKGVIVRLDFNKHFQGHTVVVPNSESQILGGLFGEASSRRRKDLCRMENVEFEDAYSVYATDQQEARYILTPKLMELIMEAQALLGAHGALRLSFHDNSMFVTVPEPTDRFEVALFGARGAWPIDKQDTRIVHGGCGTDLLGAVYLRRVEAGFGTAHPEERRLLARRRRAGRGDRLHLPAGRRQPDHGDDR